MLLACCCLGVGELMLLPIFGVLMLVRWIRRRSCTKSCCTKNH